MNIAHVRTNCQKFHSGAAAISSGAFRSSRVLNLKGRNFQSLGASNLVDKVGNLDKFSCKDVHIDNKTYMKWMGLVSGFPSKVKWRLGPNCHLHLCLWSGNSSAYKLYRFRGLYLLIRIYRVILEAQFLHEIHFLVSTRLLISSIQKAIHQLPPCTI